VDLGRALIDALSIEPPVSVALVGAGGKTTLLRALHAEARRRGWTVVAGTTTKVGRHQVTDLDGFVHGGERDAKLVGAPPEAFAGTGADLVVVEADGARSMRVKAPSVHEPVIPPTATLVLTVIGADALDRVIEDVAHRPLRVAAVCGCGPYGRLTVERAATLLTSADGGRKGVPPGARHAVVITRIGPAQRQLAAALAALLAERGVASVQLDRVDGHPGPAHGSG
jgi:molybdenum cofactor cytidylyltransferase